MNTYEWRMPVRQPPEKKTQIKLKIPPKPVIQAKAVIYPKLFKIYKKPKRQNEIIFEAEKGCNMQELERNDLKGLALWEQFLELDSIIKEISFKSTETTEMNDSLY